MTVKIGPITARYKGTVKIEEADEQAQRAVMRAQARDSRGQGTAAATITSTMEEVEGGTRVHVETDMRVTGPAAQFGRGVMQDVSAKLMGRFADCLAEEMADGARQPRPPHAAEPAADADAVGPRSPAATPPPGPAGDSAEAAAAEPAPPRRRTEEVLDLGEASRDARAQAPRAGRPRPRGPRPGGTAPPPLPLTAAEPRSNFIDDRSSGRSMSSLQDALGELARFRLDGRVAVVAGGSGGIGARLCAALGGVGARLVVIGRDADRASDALDDAGGDGIAVAADVTRKADADGAIDAAMQAFGRVDVIVNAVGGGAGGALYPAEEYPESEWDRMLDLNLRSALLPTQAAVRAMIAGGSGGRVLHLSSVRGQLGIDNGFSAYVAAKGALDALTRQQATEWAKHDITVNAISPTFVRTPQVEDLLADDAFREGLYKRIPLGRIAETDDVVGAVLLLTSDASAFITGQVLTLDGGLTACQ